MQYQQQAPPRKSGGGGGGCLGACLAALCCCCVAEEGCEACADCAGEFHEYNHKLIHFEQTLTSHRMCRGLLLDLPQGPNGTISFATPITSKRIYTIESAQKAYIDVQGVAMRAASCI